MLYFQDRKTIVDKSELTYHNLKTFHTEKTYK